MISNALNTQGSGGNIQGGAGGFALAAPSSSGQQTPPIIHPTVTAPVKKQVTTLPNGTVQETHFDNTPTGTTAGVLNSPTQVKGSTTQTPPVSTIPGFIGDNGASKTYAQGVSDSSITQPQPTMNQSAVGGLIGYGQGQNNNPTVTQAQQGLLGTAGQAQGIANDYSNQIKQTGLAGANAASGYATTGTSPVGEGNAAVVNSNTSAKQQAEIGAENAALQGIGYQQSGFNQAGGLGSTQQSQNIGALGSAASQSSPTTQFGVLTNPQTGQPISPDSGTNSAIQGGIIQGKQGAAQSLEQSYQQGLAQLRAADNIEPQIVATINANPTLNQTPVSALTNLNQWFSEQTSDPAQQQLKSQISNYIKALGLSPDQSSAIAVQKGATIATLLKTLRDSVAASNEGNNPSNIGSGSGGSASDPAGLGI